MDRGREDFIRERNHDLFIAAAELNHFVNRCDNQEQVSRLRHIFLLVRDLTNAHTTEFTDEEYVAILSLLQKARTCKPENVRELEEEVAQLEAIWNQRLGRVQG